MLNIHNPEYIKYENKTYTDPESGAVRWKSSDNVVPDEVLERVGEIQFVRDLCDTQRKIDQKATIERYIAYRAENGYSAEEKAEMKAEFGDESDDVVDVFTGQKVFA